MILDRLEEGCELVLALAVAPVICEVMGDVTRINPQSCDVLRSTRYVRNTVRDKTKHETRSEIKCGDRGEVD
jgi:hypothetical protein